MQHIVLLQGQGVVVALLQCSYGEGFLGGYQARLLLLPVSSAAQCVLETLLAQATPPLIALQALCPTALVRQGVTVATGDFQLPPAVWMVPGAQLKAPAN